MIEYSSLVKSLKWRTLGDYVEFEGEKISEEAERISEDVRRLREFARRNREVAERIKSFSGRMGKVAREKLRGGKVVGIDGSMALYPTPTGQRCRIAVSAVNYVGDNVYRAVYMSDLDFVDEEVEDIMSLLREAEKLSRLSPLLYRSLMLHEERRLALERGEEWKMLHGPIVPLEMRLGRLGVTGVLEENLSVAERLVEHGKVVGVLSSTRRLRILNLGYLLRPGEYMRVAGAARIMREEARRVPEEERVLLEDFIERYGDKIIVGVFRAGGRAYVFEAVEGFFDEAAHIVLEDSRLNAFKGFPLLLEYADRVVSRVLNGRVFAERFEYGLASRGVEGFEMYFDERRMRW